VEALLLLAALNCSVPQIVNRTSEWIELDRRHLTQAVKRCPEIDKDYPCVKVFVKKEDRVYNVICGGQK